MAWLTIGMCIFFVLCVTSKIASLLFDQNYQTVNSQEITTDAKMCHLKELTIGLGLNPLCILQDTAFKFLPLSFFSRNQITPVFVLNSQVLTLNTLTTAEILSGKNEGACCMGLNGFIFKKINENQNIKRKKILGAV